MAVKSEFCLCKCQPLTASAVQTPLCRSQCECHTARGSGTVVAAARGVSLCCADIELHSVYRCTCKHVFAKGLWSQGCSLRARSSESCHKLAIVKSLCAHELHPGHISFTWGKHTSVVPLQRQRSSAWWLGSSGVGCVGHTGTSLLPSAGWFAFNTKRRHQHPFALLSFLVKIHVLPCSQEEEVYV